MPAGIAAVSARSFPQFSVPSSRSSEACRTAVSSSRLDRKTAIALVLILGGAVGNVFDRIRWGTVTDFLLFYIGSYQWPAFNAADSAIVIGSGLLLLDFVKFKRQPAHTQNVS
jgi:lipoprotein signal peptidase